MNKFIIKNFSILLYLFVLSGSCEKDVSHSPVASSPSEGKIVINSIPSGFTIYQNGRNTGRTTPDSLIFLAPAKYEITLKKNYWKDTTVVIGLAKDTSVVININYLLNASMYGRLALYSNPLGANILINDSLLNNVTPDTLKNFLPGMYSIIFRMENYRDAKFEAIAESNRLKSYSANLKDTSVWIDFKMSNSSIQSDQLSAIAIDHRGIKWIGTLDKGLIRYDDHIFTNYSTTNSPIPDNYIRCVSVDAKNNIWVGTTYGIGVFDGSGWVIYDRNNSGLLTEIVNTIQFDENNIAWIGTINDITKFDGLNWIIYNSQIGHDYINDIFIQSNKIWLSTNSIGVLTFQNGKFYSFSKSNPDFPSLYSSSIASDMKGNIWFCFSPDSVGGSGGIVYWDSHSFTTLYSGIPDNFINDICIDNENNKWICTSLGLIWYNDQNMSQVFTTFNSLISTDKIIASVRDKNGVLWIATYKGGLNKFKVNNL